MRKKTILSIIIFSLVFLTGYFTYFKIKNVLSQKESFFPIIAVKHEGPTMRIKGFKLEESNGEKLEWVLAADEAQMFKDKGEILFTTVSTDVKGDGKKKEGYVIKSSSGMYYTKEDKINFSGKVDVNTSNGYNFTTESVLYTAKDKKLATDDDIAVKGTLEKGDKIFVTGKGFNGNAETGDFNIRDKVYTKVGANLEIKSNKVTINTKKSTAIFVNEIVAKKDKMNIKGDKLEVTYGKSGDVNDIDVEGNVKLMMDKKVALCDNAVIKGNSSEIVLTGKPELHVGEDIMVGEKIVFFTDNDEVFVEKVKADVSRRGYKK
ncbi:MAG: LPS export ABC transporter periplasmic protein LptC [bacterium]